MKQIDPKEIISKVEDYIINEFGHYFDQMGAKNLLGRIFGLLITRSEPVSLKELAEKLKLTKSAVSTTINSVSQLMLFQKVYVPENPRESFYRIGIDSMEMMIDPGIQKMQILIDKLKNSLNMLYEHKIYLEDGPATEMAEKLEYMNKSFEIVLEEYNILAERVKKRTDALREEYKKAK